MNVLRKMLPLTMVVAMLAVAMAPLDAYADPEKSERKFSALYVFGDSLSDPGNTWALRHETASAPYAPIPKFPYDSRRFSNGKTWVEILAKELGTKRGGKPAYKKSKNGNYAVAGARAQGTNEVKPTFGDQVARYLGTAHGVADPNALYVVQFGGNDIRDALETAQSGGDPFAVIGGAMQALAYNITLLSNAGAKKFLVGNIAVNQLSLN